MLEQAGWKRGSDGIRLKDGRRMKVLFQTSANPVRQKTQAIVKKTLEQIGIEVELKAVAANVYFASDPGNPDTYSHFYADMQMSANSLGFDPQGPMRLFVSWEIAQKANQLGGAKRRALGQRRVRSALEAGGDRVGPGQRAPRCSSA